MNERPEFLSRTYRLLAGECDPERRMPVTLVAERVIAIASEHANLLGIGYADLLRLNMGWVLSRLSIEMEASPEINSDYTVTTWIESCNRHFSERNFAIADADGRPLGYVRSVWAAMDFTSRALADLTAFDPVCFPADAGRECPIARPARVAPMPAEGVERSNYMFRYCDLDFNRHVNTVRYIDMILNHWPLEHYDRYRLCRLDIQFHRECRFADEVEVLVAASGADASVCELRRVSDGVRVVTATLRWAED